MTTTHTHPAASTSLILRDPHARLAVSLVVSLLLWTPFGMAAMRGELDVVSAGLRFLVAFVGCRCAVGGIGHLLAAYHDDHLRSSGLAGADPSQTAPGAPEGVSSPAG